MSSFASGVWTGTRAGPYSPVAMQVKRGSRTRSAGQVVLQGLDAVVGGLHRRPIKSMPLALGDQGVEGLVRAALGAGVEQEVVPGLQRTGGRGAGRAHPGHRRGLEIVRDHHAVETDLVA